MLFCPQCDEKYAEEELLLSCTCSSYLEWDSSKASFSPNDAFSGFWSYASSLPIENPEKVVSLNEQKTPLASCLLPVSEHSSRKVRAYCKLDYLLPSGSYKDRGIAVLLARLYELGLRDIVEDSSGNAGASMSMYAAAYANAHGEDKAMKCRIFVPAYTSLGKCTQIAAHGVDLVRVEGTREATTEAAMQAAFSPKDGREAYYASHNWSPYFAHGVKTYAFEIVEQLAKEGKKLDNLIVPLGQGSLVLGAHLAFSELKAAGIIDRMPKIFGVQTAACAPIVRAFEANESQVRPLSPEEKGQTLAEGIASADPLRGDMVLRAVRESGGALLAVSEESLLAALKALAKAALYVEPTSATAMAGFWALLEKGLVQEEDVNVIFFSGNGLKATSTLEGLFFDSSA